MTLHEAIVKLLRETGRPMAVEEIAEGLNRNKWYEKRDKSEIKSSQISARIGKYPHLFEKEGSKIKPAE